MTVQELIEVLSKLDNRNDTLVIENEDYGVELEVTGVRQLTGGRYQIEVAD